MSIHGVGIGFRPSLAGAMLQAPERFDFVEVVAEACRDPRRRREAIAIAELWPVIPHGVKMSLGSADGIDDDRARAFGTLARELHAPLVSEHVAFVRAGGREIGHLTELPMTRAAVDVVVRNVARLRRRLPDVPLLLENVARAFVWDRSVHEMTEGDFHHEIAVRTGCDLLLDLGNLYANATNRGADPSELLVQFPLDRVQMVHVAGGVLEDGFYFDTHAHPVPGAVFDLVARVLEHRPDVAVLLERDARLDDAAAIFAEVDRLRGMERQATSIDRARATAWRWDGPHPSGELARAQAMLATQLTQVGNEANPALLRARSILARKRADEARSPRAYER
jgi:uncharacterized protein